MRVENIIFDAEATAKRQTLYAEWFAEMMKHKNIPNK